MLSVNGNSTFGKTFDAKVGGALSRGEWASLIQAVFDPASDTIFRLVPMDVYPRHGQFKTEEILRLPVPDTKVPFRAKHWKPMDKRRPGHFTARSYVPMDANVVWRITVEPEPSASFPLQDVKETLKYDRVNDFGSAVSIACIVRSRDANRPHRQQERHPLHPLSEVLQPTPSSSSTIRTTHRQVIILRSHHLSDIRPAHFRVLPHGDFIRRDRSDARRVDGLHLGRSYARAVRRRTVRYLRYCPCGFCRSACGFPVRRSC